MAKPFSLQPLLELMQTRTDEATRRLGQLISAEQSAKSRLQLLEQYREEYSQRFRESAQLGMTPLVWRNFQDFMGRIDEAIAQQRETVAQHERSTVDGQSHWREQNKRLKAIDTLSDRHFSAERHREGKLDQKQQDEFAARSRKEAQEE
ncbi:MAG: flagellar export protein FliJ [Betaproteobacteria bacterium]